MWALNQHDWCLFNKRLANIKNAMWRHSRKLAPTNQAEREWKRVRKWEQVRETLEKINLMTPWSHTFSFQRWEKILCSVNHVVACCYVSSCKLIQCPTVLCREKQCHLPRAYQNISSTWRLHCTCEIQWKIGIAVQIISVEQK